MDINRDERNVIVVHQFVTGAERCDSEEIAVGGVDNIAAEVFADFDYIALGIHRQRYFVVAAGQRHIYIGLKILVVRSVFVIAEHR